MAFPANDDFDALDLGTGDAGASIVGGRLDLTPAAYPLYTRYFYGPGSFVGSEFLIEVPQVSTGETSLDTSFGLYDTSSATAPNSVNLIHENGTLFAQKVQAAVTDNTVSFPYDPVAHRWWKLSEAGGTVTWAVSPDGLAWTTLRTLAVGWFDLSNCYLLMFCGWWSGGAFSAGWPHAQFDNLNLIPQPWIYTNRGPRVAQPGRGPRGLSERRYATEDVAGPTILSDTDSGAGAETSDVQATVSGTEAASGADTGAAAVTLSGSDSATGTESDSVAQPTSGSDTGSGTESASVSVTAAGSDSAVGADVGVVAETGAGGDAGAGFDTGTVSAAASSADTGVGSEQASVAVTASGADTGAGTDAGTVTDLAATQVSGSDSATGTEDGTVVDLTPPAPPPDVGGGGRYEPGGDETAIYGEFIRLSDGDRGLAWDHGTVVDLTPKPPPARIRLPRRQRPAAIVPPRSADDRDEATAVEAGVVGVQTAGEDRGVGTEGSRVVDVTVVVAQEEQEMWTVLALSGVL